LGTFEDGGGRFVDQAAGAQGALQGSETATGTRSTVASRGKRSAKAARKSVVPAPVSALNRTVEMVPQPSRSTPGASPAMSHLLNTRICGTAAAPISARTRSTA